MELKAGQVAAVLGIDAKQIQNAVDAGYVRSSMKARGRGTLRLYNLEDVVRIKVFNILVDAYGIEKQRAAEMVSRAWPKPFTKKEKVLVIAPKSRSAAGDLDLAPIKLPFDEIIKSTERRIGQVVRNYKEKRRGRPEGWRVAMRESLEEISESLQGTTDDQARKAIEEYRKAKRRPPQKGARH
jgi:hypothetical protein